MTSTSSKGNGCSPFPITPDEQPDKVQFLSSNASATNLSYSASTTAPSPSNFGRRNANDESGGEEEDAEVAAAFLSPAKLNEDEKQREPRLAHDMTSASTAAAVPKRRAPDMQLGKCKWVRVFDNVTYIVAGIILREVSNQNAVNGNEVGGPTNLEILLIQEAKKKCYGKWYIPAGHVEPGETIENAVKREVLEETGYECSADHMISMEIRGSGWYRMSYACTITGGKLKTQPDKESLSAGWHSLAEVKKRDSSVQLRCRDFFPMADEAVRFYEWKKARGNMNHMPTIGRPLLNTNEAQPGLFIEFVIVKMSEGETKKIDCLVHGSILNERQLLQDNADGFPVVEFGFEFFFAMVVSKCYRHIIEDGHKSIDLPDSVIGMWCLPAPVESLRQGIRLRILCRQKSAIYKAALCVPNRYRWITLEDEEVLASLYLLPNQFRPKLIML
ncbi:NUDIX domain-containing protein [Ditylenchus destructor]|uniref:NUDIX domain-containing protein n=1 Tax=Ditylenchus destructor TaxID=166010 RepID=A0AAD4R0I4_9BILA|nr:NUDIX domain-containing protein [Ditylenchus destructor]